MLERCVTPLPVMDCFAALFSACTDKKRFFALPNAMR
jgi:hypothetical protein